MDVQVSSNSMAILFDLSREREPMPEPFRCQGDKVVFRISFSEYVSFLKTDVAKVCKLSYTLTDIKQCLRTNDLNQLRRAYLLDMTACICKELFYAEESKKAATLYKHESKTNDIYEPESIHRDYLQSQWQKPLRIYMSMRGFNLTRNFLQCNHPLWEYAVVLFNAANKSDSVTGYNCREVDVYGYRHSKIFQS